jgi:hypothetical protein
MSQTSKRFLKPLILFGSVMLVLLASCKEPEEGLVSVPGAPVPGSDITVTDITPSGAELSWSAADDDLTVPENLSYRVVVAADPASIDTVEEANALGYPQAVTGWTLGLTACSLSGQPENSPVYVAVLVKDTSDNTSLYRPVTFNTIKSAPPVVSAPRRVIGVSSVTAGSADLSWQSASDDVDPPEQLYYKVVTSPWSWNIDTPSEAQYDTTTVVQDWTQGLNAATVFPEAGNITMYYAVLVRDGGGNTGFYPPVRVDFGGTTSGNSTDLLGIALTANGVSMVLTPDFDPAWQDYSLTVPAGTSSMSITVTAAVAGQQITINGLSVTSGSPWYYPPMTGNNTFDIQVTSSDLTNVNYYYLTVTMPAGNNPPDPGSPSFWYTGITASHFTFNWDSAMDDSTPQSGLVYRVLKSTDHTAYDTLAEATTDYSSIPTMDRVIDFGTPGLTSVEVMGVAPGNTYYMTVVVKDAEGLVSLYPQHPYTHTILSSNANLAQAVFYETGMGPQYPLSPTFNPFQLNGYTVTVPPGTPDLEIVVNPEDPMATFTINSVPAFTGSPYFLTMPTTVTNVTIMVTAPDGITTQMYQFTVMKM